MTEPVDTVNLRQAAETAARAYKVPDYIFEIMHSAADELDELRKQRTAGYLMHVERTLDDERLAHAETKRELEQEKARQKSAENVLREMMDCDSELHATYQSAKAHFARYGGGNG